MVAGGRELIDTLWNVNAEKRTLCTGNKTGINRYIMECKFDYLDEIWTGKKELIDTLWNVNMEKSFKEFFFDS